MHRTVLRLPSRFSAVIPSDPEIALPTIELEPIALPSAETVSEISLPPIPPPPIVEERLAETLEQLTRAASEIRITRRREATAATRAIVDLVIAATRHLVGRKIQAGEYDLEGMISQALRKLDPQSAVVVALPPDDLQRVQAKASAFPTREDIAWEPDPSLSRGSFRIEANDISLWSDLETRLQEVRDALEQSLESADASRGEELGDEEVA
jgi:flagellar biosynthesis/type III secretory pathway protein FliH